MFKVPLAFLVLGRQGTGGGIATIHWIDGNPQNCTMANLRWHMLGKAPFRGIYKQGQGWLAIVRFKREKLTLGKFDTPEEAARAYDKVVSEQLGPKARLNFPQEHKRLEME
jgi:hypothetical protein